MKKIQERLIVELFEYHNMENNHHWYNNLDDEAETLFCNRNYYSTADWFSLRDGLVYIFKKIHLKQDVIESHSHKFYSSRYTVEYLDW